MKTIKESRRETNWEEKGTIGKGRDKRVNKGVTMIKIAGTHT